MVECGETPALDLWLGSTGGKNVREERKHEIQYVYGKALERSNNNTLRERDMFLGYRK